MQTVETVEKVPFQKLMFEKWDRNIEKRLVFLCSNKILAIFGRVVGDFLKNFPNEEFFDSLVRPTQTKVAFPLSPAVALKRTIGRLFENSKTCVKD